MSTSLKINLDKNLKNIVIEFLKILNTRVIFILSSSMGLFRWEKLMTMRFQSHIHYRYWNKPFVQQMARKKSPSRTCWSKIWINIIELSVLMTARHMQWCNSVWRTVSEQHSIKRLRQINKQWVAEVAAIRKDWDRFYI